MAPVGIPLMVKVTGAGSTVPLVGTMVAVYAGAVPGITVCDLPPLPEAGLITLKSMTVSVNVPLVLLAKLVSPP